MFICLRYTILYYQFHVIIFTFQLLFEVINEERVRDSEGLRQTVPSDVLHKDSSESLTPVARKGVEPFGTSTVTACLASRLLIPINS